MTKFFWIDLFSYSILPAAVISIIRYRTTPESYRPFLYLMILGLANEIAGSFIIYAGKSNSLTNNMYVLFEYLLLIMLFRNWSKHTAKKRWISILGYSLTSLWFFENIVQGKLNAFNSLFRIATSFAVLFLSIDRINASSILERKRLSRNATFIICSGFILYFSYKAFIEILFLLHISAGKLFNYYLFSAMVLINVLSNIIYAIGCLCLPRKQII